MSLIALERGSAAAGLQEQPVAPDTTIRQVAPHDATLNASPLAIPDNEHVKRKQSNTMSTTLSLLKETTTTTHTPIPIALPPRKPNRAITLIRAARRFLASVPLEHKLDEVSLRREITLHRLQLK